MNLRKILITIRGSVRKLRALSTRVDDNLVIFESFSGSKYNDSPKLIYEILVNMPEYNNFKFVWSLKSEESYNGPKNDRMRLVKHGSGAYFKAFAQAKYWVVNDWLPLDVYKRPEQIAVQTWHGTPLKRLRYDIPDTVQTQHHAQDLRVSDRDMKRYDYLISSSKFTSKAFTSAFNLKGLGKEDIILETGFPRNDALVGYEDEKVLQIKRTLNIPVDKKIILYAPTWRDDTYKEEYQPEDLIDVDFLRNELGSEYVLLFRSHSMMLKSSKTSRAGDFLIDVSEYDDVNDLYIISDALITDYSSVFFDYAILRRPIIFYMYDLEHYQDDLRGFYLDLNTLPGDIVRDKKQIISILQDLPSYMHKHKKRYEEFNMRYNNLADGLSTERVIRKVFKSNHN